MCKRVGKGTRRTSPTTFDSLKARCEITEDGCWLWGGNLDVYLIPTVWVSDGKGNGWQRNPARVLYEMFYDLKLPRSAVLKRRCHRRYCVKPEHGRITNMPDPNSNPVKGYCRKGHRLSEGNYYKAGGGIACCLCRDEWRKERKVRKDTAA